MIKFKENSIWSDYCPGCRTKLKTRNGEDYCPRCSDRKPAENFSIEDHFET